MLSVSLARNSIPGRRLATPLARRVRLTGETLQNWLQGQDLNLRPVGYEPTELPDCSTLRQILIGPSPHPPSTKLFASLATAMHPELGPVILGHWMNAPH